MAPPSEQTVLVTGANGFVAGHVIKRFLDRGYHVRGSVRSEKSGEGLKALFEKSGKFSLCIVPDISRVEDYKAAFENTEKPVTGVINVAAPFSFKVEDNTRDLLEPAVSGIKGILQATKLYGKDVKRLVNTSSFAAIVDIGKGYRPGYTYTEKDWNPMTKEEAATADVTTAYCCSKALAEHELWNFIEKEKPSWDAVAICSPWVFGPRLDPIKDLSRLNESTNLIWTLVDKDDVPPVDFAGNTDVRMLADAHLSAFETPEASNRRFLVGTKFSYQTAVDILREKFPGLHDRLPVGEPGKGETEPMYRLDNSTAEKVLRLEHTPLEKTMVDTMTQLLQAEKAGA